MLFCLDKVILSTFRWDTNGHPLTDLPLLSPSSTLDTVAALGSVTSLGKSDSVDSGVASVSAGHQTNAAATSSRINRKKGTFYSIATDL